MSIQCVCWFYRVSTRFSWGKISKMQQKPYDFQHFLGVWGLKSMLFFSIDNKIPYVFQQQFSTNKTLCRADKQTSKQILQFPSLQMAKETKAKPWYIECQAFKELRNQTVIICGRKKTRLSEPFRAKLMYSREVCTLPPQRTWTSSQDVHIVNNGE